MKLSLLRILLPVFAFLAPMLSFASDDEVAEDVLVLELKDSTVEYFFLNDKPAIYFTGDTLNVTTREFSAKIDSVASIAFDKKTREAVSIASVSGSKQMSIVYKDGKSVSMYGVNASEVRVYSVDGRSVEAEISDAGESVSVNLSSLPSGIYIIKVKNQSFKINKR